MKSPDSRQICNDSLAISNPSSFVVKNHFMYSEKCARGLSRSASSESGDTVLTQMPNMGETFHDDFDSNYVNEYNNIPIVSWYEGADISYQNPNVINSNQSNLFERQNTLNEQEARPKTATVSLYDIEKQTDGQRGTFTHLKNLIVIQSQQIMEIQKRSESRAQKLAECEAKYKNVEIELKTVKEENRSLKSHLNDIVTAQQPNNWWCNGTNVDVNMKSSIENDDSERSRYELLIKSLQERLDSMKISLSEHIQISKTSIAEKEKIALDHKLLCGKLSKYQKQISKLIKAHVVSSANNAASGSMDRLVEKLQKVHEGLVSRYNQSEKKSQLWKKKYDLLLSTTQSRKTTHVPSATLKKGKRGNLPPWRPAWRNNNNNIDSHTGVFLLRPRTEEGRSRFQSRSKLKVVPKSSVNVNCHAPKTKSHIVKKNIYKKNKSDHNLDTTG